MKVLVVGAASAIARAAARRWAADGHTLFLIARDGRRLEETRRDLRIRGAPSVGGMTLDATEHERHGEAVAAAREFLGSIDLALLCYGELPDQAAASRDFKAAARAIDVNGLSVVSWLTALADAMARQGGGVLAAVTSVAGDRGRPANFVYGAAKSMVSTYIEGLRGALAPRGVHVVDIRPGPVDTPMTAGFRKGPLWTSPERVGRAIVRAAARRRRTVYVPGWWRPLMAAVRAAPEFLVRRLSA